MGCSHKKHGNYQILTAALLIAGNTIGAGILGFPILTGLAGCVPALMGLTIIWLIMWGTGYIIAQRMTMPSNHQPDLPSLYREELGQSGKGIATLGYLINYYGITVAYLSGATAIIVKLFPGAIGVPAVVLTLILFVLFTGFTLFGENVVRHGNFFLMTILFVTFILLTVLAGRHIDPSRLTYTDWSFFPATLPIMLVAFTYHNTVPVACRILEYNRRSVRKALFVGTFIPWLFMMVWTVTVIGAIPLEGAGHNTLLFAFENNFPATIPLARLLNSTFFLTVSIAFALLAITTSYVAVGTGLMGFMKDLTKSWLPFRSRATDALFAFGPPLAVTLIYPSLFLKALNVAGGVGVAIVFGLLPGIILLKTRRKLRPLWIVGLLLTLFFCGALVMEVAQEAGLLKISPAVEHWTSGTK